jgi:hypothetical protein
MRPSSTGGWWRTWTCRASSGIPPADLAAAGRRARRHGGGGDGVAVCHPSPRRAGPGQGRGHGAAGACAGRGGRAKPAGCGCCAAGTGPSPSGSSRCARTTGPASFFCTPGKEGAHEKGGVEGRYSGIAARRGCCSGIASASWTGIRVPSGLTAPAGTLTSRRPCRTGRSCAWTRGEP